jgi:hypothetical protein
VNQQGRSRVTFRLRQLGAFTRIGITGLVLAMALGFVASTLHLINHYEKRDGVAGLTLDDITASYHGIEAPSPLVAALERGHPDSITAAERESLLAWLGSDRISQDYDSLDLGDAAPAEIIAASCLSCHSRSASPAPNQLAAKKLPLDYWDDVQSVAYARSVPPTPPNIIIMSMHAHALTMATMTLVIAGLGLATAFPRRLIGLLIGVAGVALISDLASWLIARELAAAVYVIVGAGAVYNLACAALLLLILVELWRPRTRSEKETVHP